MASLTNYTQNKIIDWLFRGQVFAPPATLYFALVTTASSAAANGTEVAGNNYARVAVASSLANWAGTQGAGTTAASSGTSGATSNNGVLLWPTPSASWGTIVGVEVWDAATAGNYLMFAPLPVSKYINPQDVVEFLASTLGFSIG